jgi:hypothetical protein
MRKTQGSGRADNPAGHRDEYLLYRATQTLILSKVRTSTLIYKFHIWRYWLNCRRLDNAIELAPITPKPGIGGRD